MNKSEILKTAENIVNGDREKQYGKAEDNFNTIANLWADYLSVKVEPTDIEPKDVAIMMALLKVSRIANNPGHMDNYVDGCGYFCIGGELSAGDMESSKRV